MKFTELLKLVDEYESARYSPSRTEVHFGCDCGCGGDYYTIESWKAEEQEATDAIEKMKQWCIDNNIEYDGCE